MSETPDAKAPARPAAEIIAEIETERAGLDDALTALRGSLDETLDAGVQRVKSAGAKARVVGPVVAGVVVSLFAGRAILRRRAARKK